MVLVLKVSPSPVHKFYDVTRWLESAVASIDNNVLVITERPPEQILKAVALGPLLLRNNGALSFSWILAYSTSISRREKGCWDFNGISMRF